MVFRAWRRGGILLAACMVFPPVSARRAAAQGIEPYDLTPRPAGTNLLETSFTFDHYDGLRFSDGTNVSDSGYDLYAGTVRYEYSFIIADRPAAVQVFQGASLLNDFHVSGYTYKHASGTDTLQADSTELSAEFWPYVSPGGATGLSTAVFLVPPDGSFKQGNTYNAAYNAWSGDGRLGAYHTYNAHLSVEAAVDAAFYGNESVPSGSLSKAPVYGLQIWANWDWGNGLQTSAGYAGGWDGDVKVNGYSNNRATNYQRLRANAGYWWTPRLKTDIQLARDVYQSGGYSLGLAAIARVRVLF